MNVVFFWGMAHYSIPEDTEFRKILLPNGRVLEFDGFLESCPPQLSELRALDFVVEMRPGVEPKTIASQLDAVLAKKIDI